MFDAPSDLPLVWLGLALVSVAVAGVAVGLPTAPPPDATHVAAQIDRVAASDHTAVTELRLGADRIRLRSGAVALESDGVRAHASLRYGPVTPVSGGDLDAVLHGAAPEAMYASPRAFARAAARARVGSGWRPAPETLVVRHVTWGETDVTLVG
ncbi:DUF7283 family protein [Natronomonas sp. EA1]|uniref:DUF7283 family protein n=1 Tax=Natronomonas sp. EA1 TaxID=3421655 RepID=UPI003EBF64EB